VLNIDPLCISRPGKLPIRIRHSHNIHVDVGSEASSDMTYTTAADLYLGDVSSQVYEFLYRPRPCLFLNSHGVAWQGNRDYEHWNAGPVIDRPEMLADGLQEARETHASQYLPVQQEMLARTFDISEMSSSQRAADVLLALLDRRSRTTQGRASPMNCR
jgi:CDP-glycerol glycerophosphotransferase (TagB/SpsB family)